MGNRVKATPQPPPPFVFSNKRVRRFDDAMAARPPAAAEAKTGAPEASDVAAQVNVQP